uniref:HIRAN domain-containing protein n=1 Tax=Amphimedon queenslandica TaxID=400682 RepID=A0A1X7UNR7_AMPQE
TACEAAVDGEVLLCKRETENSHDPYAVAVIRGNSIVVGHLAKKISVICSLFIKRGVITCSVNSKRKHSRDLPQGGLEIPCRLHFSGEADLINNVEALIKEFTASIEDVNAATDESEDGKERALKKERLDVDNDTSECEWAYFGGWRLTMADKSTIKNGLELNDKHITVGLKLLHSQFLTLVGLQCSQKVKMWLKTIYKCFIITPTTGSLSQHWVVARMRY